MDMDGRKSAYYLLDYKVTQNFLTNRWSFQWKSHVMMSVKPTGMHIDQRTLPLNRRNSHLRKFHEFKLKKKDRKGYTRLPSASPKTRGLDGDGCVPILREELCAIFEGFLLLGIPSEE
jgi:hypothetical protein